MKFTAITFTPGYLPDSTDEVTLFDTAAEAWEALLADVVLNGDAWILSDPEDELGPQQRSALALEIEGKIMDDRPGTVYGPGLAGPDDLEIAYEVNITYIEDEEGDYDKTFTQDDRGNWVEIVASRHVQL